MQHMMACDPYAWCSVCPPARKQSCPHMVIRVRMAPEGVVQHKPGGGVQAGCNDSAAASAEPGSGAGPARTHHERRADCHAGARTAWQVALKQDYSKVVLPTSYYTGL